METMEDALEAIVRGKLSRREEALKQFMMGRLAIRRWPYDDWHLAICAVCEHLAVLESATGKFDYAMLDRFRQGSWVCDKCEDVKSFVGEHIDES